MVDVVESNTTMLDWSVESECDWGVEEWLTEFFTCFFTSSNDLIRRVGFFFDRRMMTMRMRLMIMRRTTREMIRNGVITVNERTTDSVAVSLTALIVTDWEDTDWEGIPEMTPVDGLRFNPIGSDPEEMERVMIVEREGVRKKDNPFLMMRLIWG